MNNGQKSRNYSFFVIIMAMVVVALSAWYAYEHYTKHSALGQTLLNVAANSRRLYMYSIFGIIFCITVLAFILITRLFKDDMVWWLRGTVFSLSLVAGIIAIWILEIRSGSIKKQDHVIQNKKDIESFFAFIKDKNPALFVDKPHVLPIGFIINALDIDSQSIFVYEYSWTRYNTIDDVGLEGPFVVMYKKKEIQSVLDTLVLDDIHFRKSGIDLQIELPTHFDLTKYPFDHQTITLLMQHPNFSKNVILVPDFDNYDQGRYTYAELSPSLLLTKWHVKNAYFFYTLTDYNTNFGIPNWSQKKDFPILSYTIEIQRDIFDPLITTLLPLFIILFIVFGILLIFPQLKDSSSNSILGLFASVFFATVLSHQSFEQTIKSSGLVYFNCFYYIVYFIILISFINFLLYINLHDKNLIHYRQNIIMRLLYWPSITTLFFITTVIFFY